MRRRTRKFLGTLAMLVFVCAYALVVMALSHARVPSWPAAGQMIFYAVVGLAWILPLLPLIRWMERVDRDER